MVEFLKRQDAPDLAYVRVEGVNKAMPMIMFLGGFRSDMQGTKALYLEEQCCARGQGYIRFDYRGHGQSHGKFEDACIGEWAQDAMDIFNQCTSDDIILVGSSMGGWISLLLARENQNRIKGLIGLAAAPDFTTWMESAMTKEQKNSLEKDGAFELENDYSDPYVITKKLIDDGRNHTLLDKDLDIQIPVRLIQGMKDADVEWQVAHRIKNAINGDDVDVILLEEADHRLSSPDQLLVLNQTLQDML